VIKPVNHRKHRNEPFRSNPILNQVLEMWQIEAIQVIGPEAIE